MAVELTFISEAVDRLQSPNAPGMARRALRMFFMFFNLEILSDCEGPDLLWYHFQYVTDSS